MSRNDIVKTDGSINYNYLGDSIDGLSSQMADTTKRVVYLSSFKKEDGETDDTGRLQRAINSAYGLKLIIAENISISEEVTVGQASVIIEGVSRSTCIINLTTENACIRVTKNNGVYIGFEVYFKNFEIHGNNIANQCLVLDNVSQCKFSNIYLEKATASNLTINNSGIITFDRVYSYYSLVAATINNCGYLAFDDVNFFANTTVFKIVGSCQSLNISKSWIEGFTKAFDIDLAINIAFINATQSYFLDGDSGSNAVMVDNSNITSYIPLNINFVDCRIFFAISIIDYLFKFKSFTISDRMRISFINTIAYTANGTCIIDDSGIYVARNLLVIASNLTSKMVLKTNKGVLGGIQHTYDNEQIFNKAFVLPTNVVLPYDVCLKYTAYYNTDDDRLKIKDGSNNFRIVPFKSTQNVINSTATDITTLVNDFNNLLSALRDSKII